MPEDRSEEKIPEKPKLDTDVDRYERLQAATERQIVRLADSYERHAALLKTVVVATSFVVSVIIALIGFGFYHNMDDFKKELRDKQGDEEKAMQANFEAMTNRIENYIVEQKRRVDAVIAERFEESNIEALVQSKVREKVDKVTEGFVQASIHKQIDPELLSVTNEILEMKASVNDAMTSSSEVRGVLDLAMGIVRALNDDRDALFQLHEIQMAGTNRYQDAVTEALTTVLAGETEMRLPTSPWSWGLDWRTTSWDPGTNTIGGILNYYNTQGDPRIRVQLIKYISNSDRFPHADKLDVYESILKQERSLHVLFETCWTVNNEAHLNLNILGLPRYIDWLRVARRGLALTNCNESLRTNRFDAAALVERSAVFGSMSNFTAAAQDLEAAVRVEGKNMTNLNALAWFLATCPDEAQRDGRRATELARRACELNGWKTWNYVGTLAASCAESGNFPDAVKYQEKAIELGGASIDEIAGEKRRLALYKQWLPAHEMPEWQ